MLSVASINYDRVRDKLTKNDKNKHKCEQKILNPEKASQKKQNLKQKFYTLRSMSFLLIPLKNLYHSKRS